MERTVAGAFRYELVAEDGESIGDLTSENGSWEIGDLIPCRGHMFEIQSVEGATLHVRRVIQMGEVLERSGRRAEVKVSREELVLFEFHMAPKMNGAGPHFHKQHVDSFYVLDGELELTVAGETVHAQAGELVHVEPGVVHSFKSSSSGHVRFLNLHTPGMRFDEYIRRMDANDNPDPADYDSFTLAE